MTLILARLCCIAGLTPAPFPFSYAPVSPRSAIAALLVSRPAASPRSPPQVSISSKISRALSEPLTATAAGSR